MRTDTANFIAKNQRLAKYPRWTIEIAADDAFSDLTYFTSHADGATPSGAGTVFLNVVNSPASTSQNLNPIQANSSIGYISVEIQDPIGAITAWINSKLDADKGLRQKRLRVYLGYKGLDWVDYTLFQTQVIQDYSFQKGGSVLINCEDIQREARKDIFDAKETNLTATVEIGDTTINVNDTSEFETVFHGTSYTDAPSSTVGYVKINKEIIKYTGKTATTFTGCTRGVMATREARHEVDTSVSVERRPKVTEFIYLELPVPKLIYALLTGTLYGDAATIPAHWHLGISTTYVSTAKFIAIGKDLWNTTDDTQGKIARFKGPDKVDGKKFIETQCQPLIGCFLHILNDGQLGIKRFANAIHDANPVVILDTSNIVSFGSLQHDLTQVHNKFVINWNKVIEKDELTRSNILIDSNSVTRHKTAEPITYDLEGLDGARHTNSTINRMFDFLRDRYAGPPELLTVSCFFTLNNIDVGDIVKVNLPQIRDATTNTTLSRSFEVQRKRVDARRGVVTLSLFGSSEKATPVALTTQTTSLTDAFYTTDVDAGNKLDAALSTTLTGGVLHLDTNGTLTGQADGSLQAARYWYDGDVQLDTDKIITCTQNVVLMIRGTLTINGTLTTKGQGIAAGGTAGYIGTTKAGGAINVKTFAPALDAWTWDSIESIPVQGANDVIPVLNIDYDGSNNFSGLTGIPADTRGTSGGTGGTMNGRNFSPDQSGGAGGAGGGSITIICRGIAMGASGVIDISGNDGTAGTSTNNNTRNWYSGSGAGGSAGSLIVLLDGASAVESDVITNLVADLGNSPVVATPVYKANASGNKDNVPKNVQSYFTGYAAGSLKQAHSRIQYIPANETPAEDQKQTADAATAIVLVEQTNTPQTPAENLASIEVTVTAPSDSTYSHSNIYWKLSTESDTAYEFGGVAQDEAVLLAAMDGTTYDIKAVPVSALTGLESEDYITDSITVSNQAGGVSLATGNYIAIGQTAYDTGTGIWIGNDGGTPQVSIGNSAGDKILMTGGNISLTGTITADAGYIGGWQINANTLISTNSRVILDAGNQRIQVQNAGGTNYVRMNADGLVGVDSVLGTVFNIPTDGSAPTFASGVINSTIYNISTAGILRTSSTVGDGTANGYGVLINDTGVKGFKAGDSNPVFFLDSSNGNITAKGGTIGGWTIGTTTLANGTNIVLDASNKAIYINSSTFGNQGIQLEYNSGTPRFHVGDGSGQDITFDGSSFTVGVDVDIQGASSYGSSTFAFDYTFPSFDNSSTASSGAGSTKSLSNGRANFTVDTASGSYIEWYRQLGASPFSLSWGNTRKFKTRITWTSLHASNTDAKIGVGANTAEGFGFFYDNGTWKGYVIHLGSTTSASISGGVSSGDLIEAVFDPGVNCKFYVNGTLAATISTGLPSGTNAAELLIYVRMDSTATPGGGTITLGHWQYVENF